MLRTNGWTLVPGKYFWWPLVIVGQAQSQSSLLARGPGEGWNETVPVYVALWSQYMYNVAFHIPRTPVFS